MMKNKVLEVMSLVFEVPQEKLNEESSSENIESWDSLMHMNLVIALEEEFNVEFDEEEIIEMLSYKGVIELLEAKL
jgi:acyl carrier protein